MVLAAGAQAVLSCSVALPSQSCVTFATAVTFAFFSGYMLQPSSQGGAAFFVIVTWKMPRILSFLSFLSLSVPLSFLNMERR